MAKENDPAGKSSGEPMTRRADSRDTDDSLKAGVRGPTLLEDFHLREKITRFDHERIPARVAHRWCLRGRDSIRARPSPRRSDLP